MCGCCPRFKNGGARALLSNEKAISTNFARRLSCSAKMRRDGSRQISPSCRSYCENSEITTFDSNQSRRARRVLTCKRSGRGWVTIPIPNTPGAALMLLLLGEFDQFSSGSPKAEACRPGKIVCKSSPPIVFACCNSAVLSQMLAMHL